PAVFGRWTREPSRRKRGRREKFHETETVAQSEPARDPTPVPFDIAALVDHQIRKPAALEDRLRPLAARDRTEERIVLREDEGQSSDAGALKDLLDGGGIEPPCRVARAHPGCKRHGGEDVWRAVDGLEGDVAAE